jgi:hypothetical protein
LLTGRPNAIEAGLGARNAHVRYHTNFNAFRASGPWAVIHVSHNQGLSASIIDVGQQMKFPLFALGLITAAAVSVTAAKAQNYPCCSMVDLGDEVVNCGFESLEQCRASLSGGGDRCIENNTYKPPPPQSVSGENTAAPAQVSGAKKVQGHSSSRPPAQGTGSGAGLNR